MKSRDDCCADARKLEIEVAALEKANDAQQIRIEELLKWVDETIAQRDALAGVLLACGIVNPILIPSTPNTERIWQAIVETRPNEKRYVCAFTGAQLKTIRDVLAALDKPKVQP